MNKAVFLDRDGVLNKTIHKMGKPRAPYGIEEFAFIDGVIDAIDALKQAGFVLIVVTNQPDVARGWVKREQVELVNDLVKDRLAVQEIYSCFHTENDFCECRKPKPGMLLAGAKKWDIDLSESFMVGDRSSDVEAGLAAGCKSILVGDEADHPTIMAHYRCLNLFQATQWILRH